MYIPDKGDFEPSLSTLNKWLSTRKPSLKVGRAPMPSYFHDGGNSADTSWFWVAVIGEFIGLITTIYGGWKSGGVFLIFSVTTIIMFIFCDFFFAVKLHRKKALECELESMLILVDDSKKAEIQKLKNKLNEGKLLDFLFETGIIVIALIKIFGILLLGVFNMLLLYIPFAAIYLIVAYVHLKHTGYYFAYVSTENAIRKEHILFADGTLYKASEVRERVVLQIPLKDLPIKHTPHEIIVDPENNQDNFTYLIKAKGVLTDADIINLINGQDTANKIAVFNACRTLQLGNYINTDK